MQVRLLTHYVHLFYNKNEFSNDLLIRKGGEFCELKQKEVINIHTCRSLGCPLDVEFCCETARLKALIMPEPGKFCWCFSKENEYSIPWDCIRQIGEDIILVDFRNEKLLSGE